MNEYFYAQVHPEKGDDEVFIGNVHVQEVPYLQRYDFKTFRVGEIAYDIHGNILEHCKPMFIGLQDAEEYGKSFTI